MNLLLVEDDANDKELVLRSLRKIGFAGDVSAVASGESLFEYLDGIYERHDAQKGPPPDLILLDLSLPGISGLDVLNRLRTHKVYSRIPVVVLSGSPYARDVADAYRLGARTFFSKPLDAMGLDLLVAHISQYWELSQRPGPGQA